MSAAKDFKVGGESAAAEAKVISREKKLAQNIVNDIRAATLLSIREAENNGRRHDPWSEEVDGVGWLANDVGFAEQIWQKIYPDYKEIGYKGIPTVKDFEKILEERPLQFLIFTQKVNRLMHLPGGGALIDGVQDGTEEDARKLIYTLTNCES